MPDPIEYSELNGSPKENYSLQDFTITKEFVCAWTDRVALKTQLYTDGFEGNRCVNVAIEPYQNSKNSGLTSVAAYEQAKLTAQFSLTYWRGRVKRELVDGVQMSEQIVPTTEFLTIPPKDFRWGKSATEAPDVIPEWESTTAYSAGERVIEKTGVIYVVNGDNGHISGMESLADDMLQFPKRWGVGTDPQGIDPDAAPGWLVKSCDYLYTLYEVENLPATFYDLIGRVNSAALTLKTPGMTGVNFPAQTLLYNPPTVEREITSAGALAWTLQYRFSFKPNYDSTAAVYRGWNWFWKADVQGWRQLYTAGGVFLPYPTASFAGL